jgi:ParB/RepB/Spo0J family partition protein
MLLIQKWIRVHYSLYSRNPRRNWEQINDAGTEKVMRVEFHQLDRRWEHLRVHRPERQRRLLASLAASGQQTPIVVVAIKDQVERYLVVDGYQRIRALEQLGRDTVEAVVWPLSEVEALVLGRSISMAERATALEEGWLLLELERSFGCRLEELARRFDRSLSWVSRRLALVELLPERVQQQVRSGALSAQVAMKVLVPMARSRPDDCSRMAEALVQNHCTSREAGWLYAAWRKATPAIRQRLLEQPQLFLKAERQRAAEEPLPAGSELLRDLEMVISISRRANRRLVGATIEMDATQSAEVRSKIDYARAELKRLATKIPNPLGEEQDHVESKPTDHDSGTAGAGSEQARDRAGHERQSLNGAQSSAFQLHRGTQTLPSGEGRSVSSADSGADEDMQGEPGASPGGTGGAGGPLVVLDADRLLFSPWDRTNRSGGSG